MVKELAAIKYALYKRLDEKGYGEFSSTHEMLGIITEEYLELVEAVRSNNQKDIKKEVVDITVACIFGCACINKNRKDA